MASRSAPPSKPPRTAAKRATPVKSRSPEPRSKPAAATKRAPLRKPPSKAAGKPSATPKPAAAKPAIAARRAPAQAPDVEIALDAPSGTTAAPRSTAQRDSRFNLLLHTACLKAGTAAAVQSISAKVPLLGRLAPVLLSSVSDMASVPAIQKQLVRDVLEVYALDLSDDEERGVILLSTGGKLGMQMLSDQMAQKILAQFGVGYLRLVTTRMLPLASIATDIAATIALTYTVGRRAQVLCKLPGSGARNLGDLLGGLSRIDQKRLFAWSGEALRLALRPFRSVLLSLR